MKLGYVLISNQLYGTEKVVLNLANEIANQNIEVHLFLNDNLVRYIKNRENIIVHKLGYLSLNNPIFFEITLFISSLRLIYYLCSLDLNFLHLHSDAAIRACSKFAAFMKMPFIITFHGSDIYNYTYLKKFVYRYFIKPTVTKAMETAFCITCNSGFSLKYIPNKFRNKTTVIPNGIDHGIFKPLETVGKSKKVQILFVGRYIEIKGIRELLNVAKALPEYDFLFVGTGPLKEEINLKNTNDLGYMNSHELAKIYNQSTVCVFPSYREGFSLVGLEAMACGKAIIATPFGFTEYAINGINSLIIEPKNELVLKNSIIKLVENQNLRIQLEKNAMLTAIKYTWNNIAIKYLDLYRSLVKKKEDQYE